MSVHRLNTFIRENFHDVIDYWVERNRVRYTRVVSRKTGRVYLVKVWGYDVEIGGEDRDPLMKSKVFFLEPVETPEEAPEVLRRLYDTFLSAFPEHRDRFVLHRSDYFMETRDRLFRVANCPTDGFCNYHLVVDLEWFYENLYIVNHEIDRNAGLIEAKAQKMYDGFIPMYTNLIRDADKDVALVQGTWSYLQEQTEFYDKSRVFFVSVCDSEYNYQNQMSELNNIRAEALSFQDTVRRSYKRKTFHEKLAGLRKIHLGAIEKLMFFQAVRNNLLLRFLFFISDISLLLSKFHSHFLELENLVPVKERKKLLS